MKTDLQNKIEELEKAKENVKYLLEIESALVDFHDLQYWAGIVLQKRKEVVDCIPF